LKAQKIVCLLLGAAIFLFAEENAQFLSKATSSKLTLTSAIEQAVANNPELKAKKSDINAQEQKFNLAQSAQMPTLALEGSVARFDIDQRLVAASFNGEPGEFGGNVLQSSLVMKIPLYVGGKIVADIEANRYLVMAQKHLLANSQNELIFNIRTLFWSIYTQEKTIESLLFSLDTMQKHQNEVQLQYELKDVAKVDILKTNVRIADLKQMLEDAKNKLSALYSILYITIGFDNYFNDDGVKIDMDEMDMQFDHTFMLPKDLYQKALQNRGDYLSLKAKLEALKQEVIIAKAGDKPTVGFYGNYTYRDLMDEANSDESTGSIGLSFSIPLYTGGATEAKIGVSYANLQATKERLLSLELKIQNEIRNAISEFESSRKRAKLAKEAIDFALENLRIEELKYSLGKGSQTDLMDAQNDLLNAQTNHAKMVSLGHIAYAKIIYATGEDYTQTNANQRKSNVQ